MTVSPLPTTAGIVPSAAAYPLLKTSAASFSFPRGGLPPRRETGVAGGGARAQGPRACTALCRGLPCGFDQGGMPAQPEVIVGREVEHSRRHLRVRGAQGAAQAGLFEFGQVAVEEGVEIHALTWAPSSKPLRATARARNKTSPAPTRALSIAGAS